MTRDRDLQGLVQRRDAQRFLLGAGVFGTLIIVIAFSSGTRPVDLVRGLFTDPARFSNAFTIPIGLPVWVVIWGAVCLIGAVFYRRYRNRHSPTGLIDAYAHLLVGMLILVLAIKVAPPAHDAPFAAALPLVFFAAIPRVGASDSERIARVALVALAVLEGLLAYPVAGAQLLWSSLLLVPAATLCLNDGLRQLTPALAAIRRRVPRIITGLLAPLVLMTGLGWFASVFFDNLSTEASDFHANTPVTLPGSAAIRLARVQAQSLESLSSAIRSQCSAFVTLPALNSLYFWTEEGSPANWTNTWFDTSDIPQQDQIIDLIKGPESSRFCLVESPVWLYFWYQGHEIPQLPLARFVETFRREQPSPALRRLPTLRLP